MRAKELVKFSDPGIERQVKEILKAVNSVSLRPHRRDIAEDGTPLDGARTEQLDAVYVSFESKGVGIPVAVPHKLGRVPVGFVEIARTDAAGLVGFPNDQRVNRAWTSDTIHFVCQSPGGNRYTAMIF